MGNPLLHVPLGAHLSVAKLSSRGQSQTWLTLHKSTLSGLKSVQLKNKLLSYLQFQQSSGISTKGFFFKDCLLCVKYFCAITNLTRYHITTVLRDIRLGCQRYIHGRENQSKCSSASITFVSWLKRFSENYGQDGPTDLVTVLPSYLNKAELYPL